MGLTVALVLGSANVRAAVAAAADPLPSRRIDRLAAGSSRLFALRGGEVVIFDGSGEQVGRCAGFGAPPRHETRALLGAPDAEQVLRAAGLPDDDSTPEAEDALEDEGLGPRRRPPSTAPATVEVQALAASRSADTVWIATSSGIVRGDESGCAAVGLAGRDLVLVAAAGGAVFAASEDLLFRGEIREDHGHDLDDDLAPDGTGDGDDLGGEDPTFTVVAGLASRPRALAIGPDGEAIVADDDGVVIVSPDGTTTRILDRPTDAIAVCDDVAVALSSDGVYTWSPGVPAARVGDRPPARELACGRAPDERWIATGVGVWSSADGGTWLERTEMLGRSITSAAAVGGQLWLAIDDRLLALGASTTVNEASTTSPPPDWVGPASGDDLPPLSTRRLIAPTVPWPWVTAALATERTPDRHAWGVMVLLTFPLGHNPGGRLDSTALADEMVRRDLTLAGEQADLRAASSNEEVEARLTAIRQERAAFR